MYQILIVDENQEISIPRAKSKHVYRVPNLGEHILVRWKGQTKICEVEDVWTHINLDKDPPYQGAVQILVRWSRGHEPSRYVQRFQLI